jgi:hypothetical protein
VSSGATSAEMEKPHSTMTASARHDPVQAEHAASGDVHREPARGAHEPKQLSLVREVRHWMLVAPANVVEDHGGRRRTIESRRSAFVASLTSGGERGGCLPFFSRLSERRARLVRQPRARRCKSRASRLLEKEPNALCRSGDFYEFDRVDTFSPSLRLKKTVRCVVLPILPRLPAFYWSGVRRRSGLGSFLKSRGTVFLKMTLSSD